MVHTLFTLKCEGRPDWHLRCAVLLLSWMAACATQVRADRDGWLFACTGEEKGQGKVGRVVLTGKCHSSCAVLVMLYTTV